MYISEILGDSRVGGACSVVGFTLFLVALDANWSDVLSHCAFGIDFPSGGAFFSLGPVVHLWIVMTFGNLSLLIVILYDATTVSPDGRKSFGRSFDRSLAATHSAAASSVGSQSAYT